MSRVMEWIPLSEEEAQSILLGISPEWMVESMERCKEGKRTTNYKIRLTTGEQVLLRLYPAGADVSKKEMEVYRQMNGRIPVPIIYSSGILSSGNAYVAMSVLAGENLESLLDAGLALSSELCGQAGVMLARIHQRQYPKEGLLDDRLQLRPGLPPIMEWIPHFLAGRPGRKLGEEWCRALRDLMGTCQDDWQRITMGFVLTHGDFRPANLLADANGVTGVLDWEFALSAPRYFDMGQWIRTQEIFLSDALEAFAAGYAKESGFDLPSDWERLARLMDIATMMSFLDRCEEATDLDSAMMERIKWNILFVKR